MLWPLPSPWTCTGEQVAHESWAGGSEGDQSYSLMPPIAGCHKDPEDSLNVFYRTLTLWDGSPDPETLGVTRRRMDKERGAL